MNHRPSLVALLSVILLFASPSAAGRSAAPETGPAKPNLAAGRTAPKLEPVKWLRGDPVGAFDKSKVYLIECWASWCGPCMAAIPHVNSLHTRFKDRGLVVIGVDVWESPRQKAERVMKRMGDSMTYRIAYDGGETGLVAKNWLVAAGVAGIPHAFVVRDNKLLWHGHPAELTESVMGDMITGKFNPAEAAVAAEKKAALMKELDDIAIELGSALEEKAFPRAQVALAKRVEIVAKLNPRRSIITRESGAVEISLARGDRQAAAAHLRILADAGLSGEADAAALLEYATITITDPRLGEVRNQSLALECLDAFIAREPGAVASDAGIFVIRARLLHGLGRTMEAVKLLENLAAREEVPEGTSSALAELRSEQERMKVGGEAKQK